MDWNISSSVTGICWPALPTPTAAGKLAVLFQLEQSQWWSEEKLRQYQYEQLKPLLRHCINYVPYYNETLKNLFSSDEVTEEEWLSIPLLTRDEVQKNGVQLLATAMPPGHGKLSKQFTSGSTGKPIETFGTDITGFFWNVFNLRDHAWHKRNLDSKLAVIRRTPSEEAKSPHGFRAKNWGRSTQGVIETGPVAMISIFTPISEQVEWLINQQPNCLLTNPSVLQDLALYFQREEIELPSLQEVRTIAEALPDGLRELCKEVWGAKLVDIYTSVELGYIAIQCPRHDHYHVQSEGNLVEILDENNKPCAPGEVGRVVVTNLHNYATPLIRYEIGDYAEAGAPCDCGRGLPVIRQIKGRYRSMLTLPSGERIYPVLGVVELNKIAPIQQFQAIQRTLNDIEVKLVLPRPIRKQEKESLTKFFHEILRHPFNIKIEQVDSIPRSAGGKYEEFISEIKYNLAAN